MNVLRIFFLFFLFPFFSFSQLNNFQKWSIENGLPQTNVYAVLQDARGYLWIGTEGGLSRFDGIHFKTFTKKDGLSGTIVRAIFQDSKKNLWIGTDEGISFYDGIRFKTIDKKNKLSGNSILSFCEDQNGTLWAGSDDGGLNHIIRIGKDSVMVKSITTDQGLSSNTIFDLYQDKNKNIWMATFGGICILKLEKDTFSLRVLRGGRDIPSDRILCIRDDEKGRLWFGTFDEGAFKIDIAGKDSGMIKLYNSLTGFAAATVWDIFLGKDGQLWFATRENGLGRMTHGVQSGIPEVVFYSKKHGLADDHILCVTGDREGNIWMGTNGNGLSKFNGDHFAHFSEKEGLSNVKVQGITQDESGSLWLVTDGGGLSRLGIKDNEPLFENFSTKEGMLSEFATSVTAGKNENNKNIWVGTSSRGISKFDGKKIYNFTEDDGLSNNRVHCIFTDANGIVWCGTAEGIDRFDGVKFLGMSMDELMMNADGVKTIIQDKKGSLWFGTAGGLARYSGDGAIRTFDEKEGLLHKDVNCIAEGPDGNIWIGTNGGGLYMFDVLTKDTVPVRFIANDSLLSSNSVNALIFSDDHTLLAATDKGFDKILLDNNRIKRIRNYNSTDGFTGVECNDNALFRDNKGNIWFGTVKGLTRYNPKAENTKIPEPGIHITGLQLSYKNVDWSTRADSIVPWFNLPNALVLPYTENHLTFHFSGISFTNPDKIRYKYILEGWDADWSPERENGEVTYSGLSFGSYTFKVLAMNADGTWSREPAAFSFTITPPWYRTTWFYILAIITIVSLIYFYIRWREKALKEEKRILEEKVEERTREVVMQKEQIEHKNREILDSINYAKGIQDSILPPDDEMRKNFPDSFILFKPRDIVSGDFYWMATMAQNGNGAKILFSAVDCTGHGVPGAFVSILGANGLNRAVNEYALSEPAKILDKLTGIVEESMSKNHRKDGMDMSLCAINPKLKTGEFAGANNPLYLIRAKGLPFVVNGKVIVPNMESDIASLYEIKADKQPIGYFDGRKQFTNHNFPLQSGDAIYVFSDGYADQFGGPHGKKFKYSRFKELLLSMYIQPMEKQKNMLDNSIELWRGDLEQVDDICVIGVRV